MARVFIGIILLLLSAGWAANHFVSMIVVLREQFGISSLLLNGAFGIYALGLLPGLLGGGVLADRVGARPVVLAGAVGAALGNLSLLFWHEGAGLLVGRFIVGLGVGLAVSAGTAWAGRLRGASGVTLAGIILTLGFAIGPIASGLLAWALPENLVATIPFAVSSVFSLLAVVYSVVVGDARERAPVARAGAGGPTGPAGPGGAGGAGGAGDAHPAYGGARRPERRMAKALAVSLPMALWVFSCVTTSLVILTARASSHFSEDVLLPGLASVITFSAGLVAQSLGRRFQWSRVSGIIGALLAATGFGLAAYGGEVVPVWVFVVASLFLGAAYGISLREGLLGIETYTPTGRRGTAIGIYYVFTYLGFGLPVLLDALLPTMGATLPLLLVAALAVGSAVIRTVQIRTGYLPTGAVQRG
ncbi:MFS transporter [Corynebacterium faecale]